MRLALLATVVLCGCGVNIPHGNGCAYVGLAMAVVKSQPTPAPNEPSKCCNECGNTGRVKTGDGLSTVPCPCPDTCGCKAKKDIKSCLNCPPKGFAPIQK